MPQLPAAKMTDVIDAMIGDKEMAVEEIGVRPGEKTHEIMVSEEEALRTIEREGSYRERYYAIQSIIPEVSGGLPEETAIEKEYSSRDSVIGFDGVVDLLQNAGYLQKVGQVA